MLQVKVIHCKYWVSSIVCTHSLKCSTHALMSFHDSLPIFSYFFFLSLVFWQFFLQSPFSFFFFIWCSYFWFIQCVYNIISVCSRILSRSFKLNDKIHQSESINIHTNTNTSHILVMILFKLISLFSIALHTHTHTHAPISE